MKPKEHKDQSNSTVAQSAALVSVSALALISAPGPVHAALAINCAPNQIVFGSNIPCGNGSIRIRPNGSTTILGCAVKLAAADEGSCTFRDTVATKSAVISFKSTSVFLNNGGAKVTMDNFMMLERGKVTSASKLTFTSNELKAGVTVDVGGLVHFSTAQPQGRYTGTVIISVDY